MEGTAEEDRVPHRKGNILSTDGFFDTRESLDTREKWIQDK